MRIDAAKIRVAIEKSTVAIAKPGVIRLIRLAVRTRIHGYASNHKIMDFADTVIVEQRHRVWRQSIIDVATARGAEAQAATTIAELLTVYDRISKWIT